MNHEPRFIVDFMLGRLARWLRILGYDTVYVTEKNRADLLLQSLKEDRTLITRDHRLSRKRSWKMIFINSDSLPDQIRQLAGEARLTFSAARLFVRCTVCNGEVAPLRDKSEIQSEVPAYIYQSQERFSRCCRCGKIYWAGTHRDLLLRELRKAGVRL